MFGGTIDVESEVGRGTTVRVAVPMTRPDTGPSSEVSALSSMTKTDAVTELRQKISSCKVFIYSNREDESGSLAVKSLSQYITEWYGFHVVDSSQEQPDIVICQDLELAVAYQQSSAPKERPPAFVVVCKTSSRRQRLHRGRSKIGRSSFVMVCKPCGPHKLAKALLVSVEQRIAEDRVSKSTQAQCDPKIDMLEDLQTLAVETPRGAGETHLFQDDETFTASFTSADAQLAISTPSPDGASQRNTLEAYPFPPQASPLTIFQSPLKSRRVKVARQAPSGSPFSDAISRGLSKPVSRTSPPNVLLVDDNPINLKLLQTFVKKREYGCVDSAADGQQALDAVMKAVEPYDIVFMDISMPIMDGIQATKAIRAYEANRVSPGTSLIIALTGLASAEDQSDAFVAGCDLYVTKPVKFKELGRLLDNWEADRRGKSGTNSPDQDDMLTQVDRLAIGQTC